MLEQGGGGDGSGAVGGGGGGEGGVAIGLTEDKITFVSLDFLFFFRVNWMNLMICKIWKN